MKSEYQNSDFYTGMVSIIGGYAAMTLYPGYNMYCYSMIGLGGFSLAYNFFKNNKFTRLFDNLGLNKGTSIPLLKGKNKTSLGTMYRFTLPAGLSSKEFKDKELAISEHFNQPIDIQFRNGEIQIEMIEKDKRVDYYDFKLEEVKGDVPILVGYDVRGKMVGCDLSNGEPHMLISGETGAGKSTAIRSILVYLILKSFVELYLIDLKYGAEFAIFSRCDKVKRFARTKEEANSVLDEINNEVAYRYDLFFKNGVADIKTYNKKFKKKLSYKVLVIDEFADLKNEKESMKLLMSVAAMARAAGIHLIIATQRPSAKVLDGDIKANITCVLGFKTTNVTNSLIIIDHGGLEDLRGNGHGIFKRGVETEIQAPFISATSAVELIKHTYIEQTTKVERYKQTRVTKETKITKIDEIENFDFLEGLE